MENNDIVELLLNPDELKLILEKYLKEQIGANVSIEQRLGVKYESFYMTPTLEFIYNGIALVDEEVNAALEEYAKSIGYKLDSFYYVGGVRRMGQFIDEDTPYFDGVKLNLIQKQKILGKRK